ncbi:MAG: site-specific DNA-methyltransferase [Candidatus Pacebacteria bacterium]|nr:site-specific DNA-methyltransferase [Candidatus Paceibacterota bacterium]
MPRRKIPKAAASKANIDSYKHQDTRKNIPTQELSHLRKEKLSRKEYRYDPSLDPQLIWAGKAVDPDLLASLKEKGADERDTFSVDTVPLYIQEKISSEAIINRLKSDTDEAGVMNTLWGEGAEQTFGEMVDFYKHEDNWANRMILGDSLQAMNSLLEKEQMRGKVQMVYIDPPYGIKFGSNWQVSTRKRDVKDGKDEEYVRQPEQIKAFRDTWELGIHSYLAYLRDRLITARELLTESGSCFVQISDENVHLVRNMMDEVFGSENFICQIVYVKTSGLAQNYLPRKTDYIIWYGKNKEAVKYRQLHTSKVISELKSYSHLELENGTMRKLLKSEIENVKSIPEGSRIFAPSNTTSEGNPSVSLELEGKTFTTPHNRGWKTSIKGMRRLYEIGRLMVSGNTLNYKRYADDFPVSSVTNVWDDVPMGLGFGDKIYVVQTAELAIRRCILMTTDPGDIVLDPTCGSGTTAYVAEQWGRRWISTDTSRVALALARTRLMTAKYPWYKLKNAHNIKEGFEYKTVPHVTLKSLANDEEPEQEVLFDQPFESKEVVRVSGPFTVESLSPHRVTDGDRVQTTQDYVHTVVDNMRAVGVQTGEKGKRIEFESLDVSPSIAGNIHATGDYKEGDTLKRVAVCVGPEYGSVDDDLIREAVKEAAKYYDLLIVAGPSFEGSAFVEEKNPFDLQVVKVKVAPDLSMGELLKKPRSGENVNLFVAFGEPDVEVRGAKDGKITVEVKGVDVYDPTTGELRSQDTDDIACWFIDTNYNEEAFFVTHAYFTGAQKPYEKLKKALKAEIDEDLWEELYTTTSRPFRTPTTGKIAVKVINHYGDEVMKVINVTE